MSEPSQEPVKLRRRRIWKYKKKGYKWNGIQPTHRSARTCPDHPRRCQKRNRITKELTCWSFAVHGSKYCKSHRGKFLQNGERHPRERAEKHLRRRLNYGMRWADDLPMFYKKFLGPTLRELVEQQLGEPGGVLQQARDDLAMMRTTAVPLVQQYSVIYEAWQRDPRNDKLAEASIAAGAIVRSVLDDLITAIDKVSRIEAQGKGQYSVQNLFLVTQQITRIVHEVLGDDQDKAVELERLISEQLRLPNERMGGGLGGTDVTPEVLEMDQVSAPEAPSNGKVDAA